MKSMWARESRFARSRRTCKYLHPHHPQTKPNTNTDTPPLGHRRWWQEENQEARQDQAAGLQARPVGRPLPLLQLPDGGPSSPAAQVHAVRGRLLLRQRLPAGPLEISQVRVHRRGGGQGPRRETREAGAGRAGEGQGEGGGRQGRRAVRDLLRPTGGCRAGGWVGVCV